MKVEVKSKKGLRTILSVIVDKKNVQTKMDERLKELQKEVALKGFRPGKVPPAVIKSQFGKSIYGEVVDKILRETTTKAIDEKKLKVAGQPKIDLKQFGEGKDLNYELQIDCLPKVELKSFEKFKATEYKIKIENKIIEGPSFQHRSPKNASISENIVFLKGTPKFKRKVKGSVMSLLTGGGGNENYWHWLFDVLPRLKIVEDEFKLQKLKKVLKF